MASRIVPTAQNPHVPAGRPLQPATYETWSCPECETPNLFEPAEELHCCKACGLQFKTAYLLAQGLVL